ncbi:alpha-hydroxy acid oxidase [Candidatus Palauibacter soopunensis]|uniref:alpha-hydroxy acid oxidase n=1 Tax=Candidatus Palauibacter soopunensis TaxID=3056739 RepID=UPI0028735E1B|nr:alpha-hydroxy acid oxidase [Candidatus Palauibacter soopunensis]
MTKRRRHIRGIARVALLWALAGAFVGAVIEILADTLPGGLPMASLVDIWPPVLAILGLAGGTLFAAVFGVSEVSMLRTLRSVVRFRKFELSPVARRLGRCASVEDLRDVARRRLPRGVFGYIDGAAEDERTQARNCNAFHRLEFRPRVLRDVTNVDPGVTVLGRRQPLPLILAPTGFSRIADSQGELAVARAAARAGITYSLSTLGTRSIEEVAAVSSGPRWFQVYVWKDRGLVAELVERARESGYEALLLTVDVAVLGRRERDVRLGFTLPPQLGLDTFFDGIRKPDWTWDFLTSEPIIFSSAVSRDAAGGAAGVDAMGLAQYVNEQFDPKLAWDDVDWLRSIWDGPIVIKGIQTVEDAVLAADAGVEGIVISNHGGRQLDDAPPTLELLQPVAEAVGDRLDVLIDGGVRRGSDIAKAVALGAKACLTGRAYFYALGAGGERGVDLVLKWFDEGFRRTMALLGARTVDEITPESVRWRGR